MFSTSRNEKMVEVLTGAERRRRRTPQEKISIVQQTFEPGMTVSHVARLHDVNANQLFKWRKQFQEGPLTAITELIDGDVVTDAGDDVLQDSPARLMEQNVIGHDGRHPHLRREVRQLVKPQLIVRPAPQGKRRIGAIAEGLAQSAQVRGCVAITRTPPGSAPRAASIRLKRPVWQPRNGQDERPCDGPACVQGLSQPLSLRHALRG